MHLVYLDESGNTGLNLNDPQQPVFMLCALVVAEDQWQSLDAALRRILDAHIPGWQQIQNFEVHATELRTGKGNFKKLTPDQRVLLRDEWMKAAILHDVKLICRSIDKKGFAAWLNRMFGAGIAVHPYVAAFALVSRCVDNYLKSLGPRVMGMLIADENKEIAADVEKSILIFRETVGPLRFDRIIEKGFFIESHKSLPLQLCDLFALSLRKRAEAAYFPLKPAEQSAIDLAKQILIENNEQAGEVLNWLVEQGKKSAKK